MNNKNIIYFISTISICLIYILGCDNNQNKKDVNSLEYYENILNDFSIQSYYLALNVKPLHDTSFTILIQNVDLWFVLRDEQDYTIDKYKVVIKKLLVNNDTLHLDSSLYKRLSKYRFEKDCSDVIKQDIQSVKENYFDRGNLKLNFGSNVSLKNCIIYSLFKKKVLIRNNDESGLPVIM